MQIDVESDAANIHQSCNQLSQQQSQQQPQQPQQEIWTDVVAVTGRRSSLWSPRDMHHHQLGSSSFGGGSGTGTGTDAIAGTGISTDTTGGSHSRATHHMEDASEPWHSSNRRAGVQDFGKGPDSSRRAVQKSSSQVSPKLVMSRSSGAAAQRSVRSHAVLSLQGQWNSLQGFSGNVVDNNSGVGSMDTDTNLGLGLSTRLGLSEVPTLGGHGHGHGHRCAGGSSSIPDYSLGRSVLSAGSNSGLYPGRISGHPTTSSTSSSSADFMLGRSSGHSGQLSSADKGRRGIGRVSASSSSPSSSGLPLARSTGLTPSSSSSAYQTTPTPRNAVVDGSISNLSLGLAVTSSSSPIDHRQGRGGGDGPSAAAALFHGSSSGNLNFGALSPAAAADSLTANAGAGGSNGHQQALLPLPQQLGEEAATCSTSSDSFFYLGSGPVEKRAQVRERETTTTHTNSLMKGNCVGYPPPVSFNSFSGSNNATGSSTSTSSRASACKRKSCTSSALASSLPRNASPGSREGYGSSSSNTRSGGSCGTSTSTSTTRRGGVASTITIGCVSASDVVASASAVVAGRCAETSVVAAAVDEQLQPQPQQQRLRKSAAVVRDGDSPGSGSSRATAKTTSSSSSASGAAGSAPTSASGSGSGAAGSSGLHATPRGGLVVHVGGATGGQGPQQQLDHQTSSSKPPFARAVRRAIPALQPDIWCPRSSFSASLGDCPSSSDSDFLIDSEIGTPGLTLRSTEQQQQLMAGGGSRRNGSPLVASTSTSSSSGGRSGSTFSSSRVDHNVGSSSSSSSSAAFGERPHRYMTSSNNCNRGGMTPTLGQGAGAGAGVVSGGGGSAAIATAAAAVGSFGGAGIGTESSSSSSRLRIRNYMNASASAGSANSLGSIAAAPAQGVSLLSQPESSSTSSSMSGLPPSRLPPQTPAAVRSRQNLSNLHVSMLTAPAPGLSPSPSPGSGLPAPPSRLPPSPPRSSSSSSTASSSVSSAMDINMLPSGGITTSSSSIFQGSLLPRASAFDGRSEIIGGAFGSAAGATENLLGFPFRGLQSSDGEHQQQPRVVAEGLAEILLALDRVERDEDLTYEQLLMLEATLLFGGMGLHDQHSDLRLDVDNMSYEELLALEERIGNVNTGLTVEVVNKRLKRSRYSFQAAAIAGSQESDIKCSVCQEEYEEGEELGKIDCGHSYHITCIKQWLLQKNQCPICKASALS